jgi:hypothetical protein
MKKQYRKIQQLKEFAKAYKSESVNVNNKNNLLSNRDGISKVTDGSCIRPDIFLDNDRTCNGCPYLDDCICSIKRIDKKKIK